MRLEDDLARWEDDLMPLEDVVARHPTDHVEQLARLHERLSALREEPVADPERAWAGIVGRLDRRPVRRRGRWARPTVLAAAAVLLMGAAAFAASAPIREAVGDAWSALERLITGTDDEPPGARPRSGGGVSQRDVEEVRAELPLAVLVDEDEPSERAATGAVSREPARPGARDPDGGAVPDEGAGYDDGDAADPDDGGDDGDEGETGRERDDDGDDPPDDDDEPAEPIDDEPADDLDDSDDPEADGPEDDADGDDGD